MGAPRVQFEVSKATVQPRQVVQLTSPSQFRSAALKINTLRIQGSTNWEVDLIHLIQDNHANLDGLKTLFTHLTPDLKLKVLGLLNKDLALPVIMGKRSESLIRGSLLASLKLELPSEIAFDPDLQALVQNDKELAANALLGSPQGLQYSLIRTINRITHKELVKVLKESAKYEASANNTPTVLASKDLNSVSVTSNKVTILRADELPLELRGKTESFYSSSLDGRPSIYIPLLDRFGKAYSYIQIAFRKGIKETKLNEIKNSLDKILSRTKNAQKLKSISTALKLSDYMYFDSARQAYNGKALEIDIQQHFSSKGKFSVAVGKVNISNGFQAPLSMFLGILNANLKRDGIGVYQVGNKIVVVGECKATDLKAKLEEFNQNLNGQYNFEVNFTAFDGSNAQPRALKAYKLKSMSVPERLNSNGVIWVDIQGSQISADSHKEAQNVRAQIGIEESPERATNASISMSDAFEQITNETISDPNQLVDTGILMAKRTGDRAHRENLSLTMDQIRTVLEREGKINPRDRAHREAARPLADIAVNEEVEAQITSEICAMYTRWQNQDNNAPSSTSDTNENVTRVFKRDSLQGDSQQHRQDQQHVDQESEPLEDRKEIHSGNYYDLLLDGEELPSEFYLDIQIDRMTLTIQRTRSGSIQVLDGNAEVLWDTGRLNNSNTFLLEGVTITKNGNRLEINNLSPNIIYRTDPTEGTKDFIDHDPFMSKFIRDWEEFFGKPENEVAHQALLEISRREYGKENLSPEERLELLDIQYRKHVRDEEGKAIEIHIPWKSWGKDKLIQVMFNGHNYEIPLRMLMFLTEQFKIKQNSSNGNDFETLPPIPATPIDVTGSIWHRLMDPRQSFEI